MQSPSPHIPVMLQEMLSSLAPIAGETYIDGTFGAGGYSRTILEAADCHLRALDRDATVRPYADALHAHYGERFSFREGCFAEMVMLADDISPVNGIVLDIGISSMQIDTPERGFSLRFDAPLDMRMSPEGITAAELLATLEAEEIAAILWQYGEEKASRRIAKAIIAARTTDPITTTGQLRALVHRVIPPYKGGETATRTFQALRIAVNDELGQLRRALHAALALLKEGGRLVIITFHSLEDRIVKQFFQQMSGEEPHLSRHIPVGLDGHNASPRYLTSPKKKAIKPSDEEINRNPRARSATLRYAIRTATPCAGGIHA